MTCNDEPKNTVAKLRIPGGDQNILRGTWTINGSRLFIHIKKRVACKQKSSSRYGRKPNKDDIDNVQIFSMELEVGSERRRLNNQLHWVNYELDIHYIALNKKTLTKMDLNKIDFPNFYFSRVKSYQKVASKPLSD